MFRSVFVACALFLGLVAFPATSSAGEEQTTATEKITWGRLLVRFDNTGKQIQEAHRSQPSGDVGVDLVLQPTDWTTFESSQKVMSTFNVSPFDIQAVQPVVPINIDGTRGDSTEIVFTKSGGEYYYVPSSNTLSGSLPKGFLTGQATFYGTDIVLYQGWYCGNYEYAVTFNLPWCIHQTSPRRFDGTPGVVDAWAMGSPSCWGWICGVWWPPTPAWQGECDRGNACWVTIQDGSGCSGDSRYNSRTIGKMIQKRWLAGWLQCGWYPQTIASSVSALIRY